MKAVSPSCRRWREEIRRLALETPTPELRARVEGHLTECEGCRRYAGEIEGALAGLRRMASTPAEPSRDFRARWTSAVEVAALRSPFDEAWAASLDWCRDVLARNRRPLVGLAPVWGLILLFRLSAPGVSPPTPATVAHSPIQIYHALKAQTQLLARRDSNPDLAPPPQQPPVTPPAPRSNALPTAPSASGPTPPGYNASRVLDMALETPTCVIL